MIAVLALIAGVVAGLLLEPTVPVGLQPYLPIAVVAALDAVFGGVRAKLDGVFDDKQFVVSFVSNVLVAAFIVKNMPVEMLRWLVMVVVLYAAAVMFRASLAHRAEARLTPSATVAAVD